MPPRTSTSPSSAMRTSAPSTGGPTVPSFTSSANCPVTPPGFRLAVDFNQRQTHRAEEQEHFWRDGRRTGDADARLAQADEILQGTEHKRVPDGKDELLAPIARAGRGEGLAGGEGTPDQHLIELAAFQRFDVNA